MSNSPLSDKAKELLENTTLSQKFIEDMLLFGHQKTTNTEVATIDTGTTEIKIISLGSSKNLTTKKD